MVGHESFQCYCPACQGKEDVTQELHTLMKCFFAILGERQKRLYAGLEATKRGKGGGKLLALITGLSEETIVLGQRELQQLVGKSTIGEMTAPLGQHNGPANVVVFSKEAWDKLMLENHSKCWQP